MYCDSFHAISKLGQKRYLMGVRIGHSSFSLNDRINLPLYPHVNFFFSQPTVLPFICVIRLENDKLLSVLSKLPLMVELSDWQLQNDHRKSHRIDLPSSTCQRRPLHPCHPYDNVGGVAPGFLASGSFVCGSGFVHEPLAACISMHLPFASSHSGILPLLAALLNLSKPCSSF